MDARPQTGPWLTRVAVGLRRVTGGRAFRVVFAAAVLAGAGAVLYAALRGGEAGAVRQALAATAPWTILAAVAATAASYLALAASEAWALASIGRRLPPRRVLLVTFVAYALSNGLGFSVATGGAARLRFYSAWGLEPGEVGAVTLLSGTAVSCAGLVAAGLALLCIPGAPPIAVLLLAPALLWASPLSRIARMARLPRRRFARLGPGAQAAALAGGLLDWVFSGLALFVLLPGAAVSDFAPFLAIFVLGSLVSALSGVPGGLGVFDAIVLVLSRRFALPHQTAAALLLYRLIYALGPLLTVAVGFGVQALRGVGRRSAETSQAGRSTDDDADLRQGSPRGVHDRGRSGG